MTPTHDVAERLVVPYRHTETHIYRPPQQLARGQPIVYLNAMGVKVSVADVLISNLCAEREEAGGGGGLCVGKPSGEAWSCQTGWACWHCSNSEVSWWLERAVD